MSSFTLHAVLTGDVIGSSRLPESERARLVDELHETFEYVRGVGSLESTLAFEVFRGDSWQLYVSEPSEGLHVALAFRAQFRALTNNDTRLSLAVGAVSSLDLERVSRSDGPAFTASGRGLDGLKHRTMGCSSPIVPDASTRQRLFDAIASATGAFATEWTRAQARAVALTLALSPDSGRFANQGQVAAAWTPKPIRQQTVSEHLLKAHWDEISEFLEAYEAEVIDLNVEWQFGPQT